MPSNKYYQQFFFSLIRKLCCIAGQINIAADASVTSSSILGAAVTKTGTGEYTITLNDTYVAMVAVDAQLQAATAVDLVPQVKSYDVTSAKTVVINLNAGATPTNPAAACVLHVKILLRDSTVVY